MRGDVEDPGNDLDTRRRGAGGFAVGVDWQGSVGGETTGADTLEADGIQVHVETEQTQLRVTASLLARQTWHRWLLPEPGGP